MKKIFLISLILISNLFSQENLIQSGPMLGYVEYREQMIWLQTKSTGDVVVEYYKKDEPDKKYYTNIVRTEKRTAYTAKLIADFVFPGNDYVYDIYINNQKQNFDFPLTFTIPQLWEYRTDPPNFTIAFGSCAFINDLPFDRPGRSYGGEYGIFEEIVKIKPELFIWLGDNVYTREVDWYSKTGFQYRYTHSRSIPELTKLLANSINLAIWDDHDYGPNNSDRSFAHKDKSLETFELFWGNPHFGFKEQEGAFCSYVYADIEFIMLDNRFYRSPNDLIQENKTILGEFQKQWLKDRLISDKRPYKIVCIGGQFLNSEPNHENHQFVAPEERQEIIDFIDEHKIKGVVFLTGDRHFTELSKITTPNGIEIYDYTSSPLTSGPYTESCKEKNKNRIDGTCFAERSFGTIEVKGDRKNRQLILKCYDNKGKQKWQHLIKR
jgi:alkaline phosphatase D